MDKAKEKLFLTNYKYILIYISYKQEYLNWESNSKPFFFVGDGEGGFHKINSTSTLEVEHLKTVQSGLCRCCWGNGKNYPAWEAAYMCRT